MLLLIDENVPESVVDVFRQRGHGIEYVRDVLLPGTKDPIVAAAGDEMGAIVVTWNHKDFKRLAAKTPEGNVQRFRRLGRINFLCRETIGRHRAAQTIEMIEFHYQQAQQRRDKRLLINITTTSFSVLV